MKTNNNTKYSKIIRIVAILSIIYLFITSVFHNELYSSQYRNIFIGVDIISVVIVLLCLIVIYKLNK